MLILFSSVLMLSGCWFLYQDGGLTKSNKRQLIAIALNSLSIATAMFSLGAVTGVFVYLALLSVATMVCIFFNAYLVDSRAIDNLS